MEVMGTYILSVLETLANEQVAGQLAEMGVIWLVIEAHGTSIVQEDAKLVRETAT